MRRHLLCWAMLFFAASARAKEAWILRGYVAPPECRAVLVWRATGALHNAGEASAIARVAVASGQRHDPQREVEVGPRSSVSFDWINEFDNEPLWVTHVVMPDDVVVESRLEYTQRENCVGRPQGEYAGGKINLPVYTALDPAGFRHLHPAADLGTQNARVNVAIFNGGDVRATATITVDRIACANGSVTRAVAVPPHAVVQISISDVPSCAPPATANPRVPFWMTNVTTVVDQPSATWVTTLSNDVAPNVTIGSSP